MSDIVERLREVAQIETGLLFSRRTMLIDAADEITRLREDLANSLAYRDELVSSNEGLGVAITEAEQRARAKALEEAAKVAEDKAQAWSTSKGSEIDACLDTAAAIRALQSEER